MYYYSCTKRSFVIFFSGTPLDLTIRTLTSWYQTLVVLDDTHQPRPLDKGSTPTPGARRVRTFLDMETTDKLRSGTCRVLNYGIIETEG